MNKSFKKINPILTKEVIGKSLLKKGGSSLFLLKKASSSSSSFYSSLSLKSSSTSTSPAASIKHYSTAKLNKENQIDEEFITSLPGFHTVKSPHYTEIALAIQKYQQTPEYQNLSDYEKERMRILKAQLVIQSRIPFDVKNAYASPLKESTKKVQLSFVGFDKRMDMSVKRVKQSMDLCPGLIKVKKKKSKKKKKNKKKIYFFFYCKEK